MYPVLILREELVCLVILIFLCFIARIYRLGKDSRIFKHILAFAVIHVVFDIVTVWTVNHLDEVPEWLNYACHVVFYMSALLFSVEVCKYVFRMVYPKSVKKFSAMAYVLVLLYFAAVPFLGIEYSVCNGTNSSSGSAAMMGFGIGFIFLISAFLLIFANMKKLSVSVKIALLPMLLVLVATIIVQIYVKEFLFTGGAITIVTVGFFFSLENPAHVFEQKAMTDALTGLKSRHSYDSEMAAFDAEFRKNPSTDYTFAYCDMNRLRNVNNVFGHQEGDRYITYVAKAISDNLRHAASVYRLGGDEFLAVYCKCPEKIIAAELRRLQEACYRTDTGKKYFCEVAVGYATSSPQYKNLSEVIRTADYLMYKNKAEMIQNNTHVSASAGTKLNLSGLTDRVFNAMCASSDRIYPFITNLETDVTRISPDWKEFFGFENEYMANFMDAWTKKIHPDDAEAYLAELTAVMNDKKRYHEAEFRALAADGTYVKCSCRGAIYHGQDYEPDIFVGYLTNHGVQEKVDPITGLPNFLSTDDYVQDTIDNGKQAIIIKLGINRFSRMNMLYGYLGGNKILRRIAELLQKEVEPEGLVFCQDGSNFSLFLPNCTRERATEVYNNVTGLFATGISIDDVAIPLSISGGAVEIRPGVETSRKIIRSSLIYALDESEYTEHSKLVFYDDCETDAAGSEFQLLAEIHHDAVSAQKYFRLRYQPIISNTTGKVVGAEALLRWAHPEHGEVSPARFISFLENDPCYHRLGIDIIRNALHDCAAFRRKIPDFRISVNITAIQLQDKGFPDAVLAALEEFSLPADSLILELTERCKELDTDFLREKINVLRSHGVRIALDDMGTGYSTVNLLLNIDVDEIKLDNVFVRGLMDNQAYQVFVEALVRGKAERGYDICFEGIETEEMLNFVRKYGSEYSQGFYFSRPVFDDDFLKYISD